MRFSERVGKRQLKTSIQYEGMDDDLRNGLWNVITVYLIDPMNKERHTTYVNHSIYKELITSIWFHHFKETTDSIHPDKESVAFEIKRRFFKWDYLDVYDFVEFLANQDSPINSEAFVQGLDFILKRELSAYRFLNFHLVPITSESEINEIKEALSNTNDQKLRGVNVHLKESLTKLSDKRNPDYRNSIKESVSAVESLCQIISGDVKGELGKTLKKLKPKVNLHSSLEQGFIKIYGYTSDSDGIRHALLEETNLDQEDAMFMLISCSAFVNYLISKSKKAGINLG